MGWFDEQIRQRKKSDNDMFAASFLRVAQAVTGRKESSDADGQAQMKSAMDEILKYYHVQGREIPDNIKDGEERLEYLLRPTGMMRRRVTLEKGWFRDACGAMLGVRKEDGSAVALIPSGFGGYTFYDSASGKRVKVDSRNEAIFDDEALAFYRPFPLKKMGARDMVVYIFQSLSMRDLAWFAVGSLAAVLLGMVITALNKVMISDIIGAGSMRLLIAMTVFLTCVTLSMLILNSVKTLLTEMITTKIGVDVQAATVMRVFSLPADFFKEYSSGELLSRTQYISMLCDLIVSTVISAGLTFVFSLLYFVQIFSYAPALVIPVVLVTLAVILLVLALSLVQVRVTEQQMDYSAKESGMSYALISGIRKIRLAGAEKRAFSRWANIYSKGASLSYNPPLLLRIASVLMTMITLAGTFFIFLRAIQSGVSVADFYAFNTAYGSFSGSLITLANAMLQLANMKPILTMAKPILEAVPEVSEDQQVVSRLSGAVELNNISFRYRETMPWVLDDLSLKIRPGEYVAIVGATGCGKSTLMRLMLGFETPQKGAVYYDGRDLKTIDLKSLRRKIGVVMQDGRLFQGDIYSNIIIAAPNLTLEDAWWAAEMAGMADDIRSMPMGMNTMISEGLGGISGGQRQRLMIARAIAPKPRILMFDEATSALDNMTQKVVSDSLAGLKCTRVVIAHRLSTIRQCDRIIMLNKGKIAEEGTYEELIERDGYFAELVERQRTDVGG